MPLALERVSGVGPFYDREYDPTWFERQYSRRRERTKEVHRGCGVVMSYAGE